MYRYNVRLQACDIPALAESEGLRGILRRPGRYLARLVQSHRDRAALRYLDDSLLKDVGLSRADVETELGKRFWQI